MSALPTIINPFKLAREAVWETLAADPGGFNDGIRKIAGEEQFTPFTIDWNLPGSANFMFAQFDPDIVRVSQWISSWPAVTIYGIQALTENAQKFVTFSGTVGVGVDVWLRYQELSEIRTIGNELDTGGNYEEVGDASLAVAYSLLRHSGILRNAGVVLVNAQYDKAPTELEGDGWAQRCTLALELRVHE